MKKILSALTLTLTAIVSASAIAGPNDHRDHRTYDAKNYAHWNKNDKDRRFVQNNRFNHGVNPSREWRSGQKLPRQFSSARYAVNNYELKRLPKANRNQQWYKINGDYVLVNEKNDKIVKIIG